MVDQRNNPPHWSPDERYFALAENGMLTIWDFPSWQEFQTPIPRIHSSMAWSPNRPQLALWVPPDEKHPAEIRIFNARTHETEATAPVLNASNILFAWSPCGSYLLALCQLTLKKGKTGTTILVFRVRERDIPVDRFEIKEKVYAFEWSVCDCFLCSISTFLILVRISLSSPLLTGH